MYFEKATKFCKIFTLLLSYVVPVKSKVKISRNFVAFSEYMNFIKNKSMINDLIKVEIMKDNQNLYWKSGNYDKTPKPSKFYYELLIFWHNRFYKNRFSSIKMPFFFTNKLLLCLWAKVLLLFFLVFLNLSPECDFFQY